MFENPCVISATKTESKIMLTLERGHRAINYTATRDQLTAVCIVDGCEEVVFMSM